MSGVFQDGAAAVAPAQSLSSGSEGASAAGPAGLQRKLHPADRHPAGVHRGPAPGTTRTIKHLFVRCCFITFVLF